MKGEAGEGRINMKDSRFLFWNQEGLVYEMFRYWNKKFSMENRDITCNPSHPWTLSLPKTFWNTPQKVSSTKCFGAVRQNNFDGKSWYPPPLLSFTFFDTRNFLKHRKISLRKFSVLWDNKLSTKNRYIPLLYMKFFDTGIFFETL